MNKDITIVTCYLDINKSKHSKENYKIWIKNLLKGVAIITLILYTLYIT